MRKKSRDLSGDQHEFFSENGYLFLEGFMSDDEVRLLSREADRMKQIDSPGRVMENNSGAVRALNGAHLESEIFDRLTRLDYFLNISKELLGDDVYLYQFKVNFKEAFDGEIWEWHQDFSFWHFEDGMPSAKAINIGIFLDDVTEFNGPLIVMPGSHKLGLLRESRHSEAADRQENWESDFSVKLKFSLGRDLLRSIEEKGSMVAPKGKRGSVLIFDPNTVHGSGPNMSSIGRRLLIVTYNSVENAPAENGIWRPEFLVGRNVQPLRGIGDCLLR